MNIHNPSIEVHLAPADKANGMAVIVAAGGGNQTCNVGPEGTAIAEWLNGLGVHAFIERYRLRPYGSQTDALADTQRCFRIIRANAKEWGVDPKRVGIMGFSAGGEQAAWVALKFDEGKPDATDPVERLSCRPDFAVLVYAGWRSMDLSNVPKDAPPAFLVSAGLDDAFHARQTVEFYDACFKAKVPVELHIYSHGGHGGGIGARKGIPFGTWHLRFVEGWGEGPGVHEANEERLNPAIEPGRRAAQDQARGTRPEDRIELPLGESASRSWTLKRPDLSRRALLRAAVGVPATALASQTPSARGQGAGDRDGAATFQNPLFAGDYADPTIARVGEDFYLTHTTYRYAPGLVVWHSRDLVNWVPISSALSRTYGEIWAPDFVEHQGRYFIYFPKDGRLTVVHAADPRGPWSEPIDSEGRRHRPRARRGSGWDALPPLRRRQGRPAQPRRPVGRGPAEARLRRLAIPQGVEDGGLLAREPQADPTRRLLLLDERRGRHRRAADQSHGGRGSFDQRQLFFRPAIIRIPGP